MWKWQDIMHKLAGKSLTVLGDSLSMIRVEHDIFGKDLYTSQLMLDEKLLVFNRAKRACTTEMQCHVQNIYDDIKGTDSDYYVIQLGVCDSYPRIFSPWQHKVIAALPPAISKQIIGFRSKRRLEITKKRPLFNVPLEDFVRFYNRILDEIEKLPGARRPTLLINIGYPSQENIERNYNLVEIIESYNAVIRQVSIDRQCYLIDFYSASKNLPALMLDDGIHITRAGHQYFHDQICLGLEVLSADQPACEAGHVTAEK